MGEGVERGFWLRAPHSLMDLSCWGTSEKTWKEEGSGVAPGESSRAAQDVAGGSLEEGELESTGAS